jgi:hypothetical protein
MRFRYPFGLLAVCSILAVLLLGAALLPAAEPTWKAGLARVVITPKEPVWMAGYAGRDHPAEGVLHDLWVKALTLEDPDGNRGVIVTSDLEAVPGAFAKRICDRLERRCGLQRRQIMITCSHTHSAPVVACDEPGCYPLDDEQLAKIKDYTSTLEDHVVDVVADALSQLTPAVLHAGEGKTTYAVNRRNNKEKEIPAMREQGVAPQGPSDHAAPVLTVSTPEGKLRAVVFGYACHCTTLSIYQWSGDHAGFAQLALEREHPGVQAMFWQGCGADQNPLPRRTVELCRKYGEMLADSVNKVINDRMRPVQPQLRTGFEMIELRYGEQPTKEELQELAKQENYRGRWAQHYLDVLNSGGTFPKSRPYHVQVWRLGRDPWWIALGGEVVVDYALLFKAKYGPTTRVTGYANDVMAYIPSHRVWEEGGYEAGGFAAWGLPAKTWSEDIETRITSAVERIMAELR